jgi:hypothetical protein
MALCVAVGTASAIGVFFDQGATDCDGVIPQNAPFTFYIITTLGGDAAANGMIGTEYLATQAVLRAQAHGWVALPRCAATRPRAMHPRSRFC